MCHFLCFKQKTAYEMRISDWSSDVCSSDLLGCETCACHRMPLVTITAGVERERPFGERFGQRLLRDGDEPRAAIFSRETAIGTGTVAAPAKGPHRIIVGVAALRRSGHRKQPRAIIIVVRPPAMLAPAVDRNLVGYGQGGDVRV